MGYWVFGDEPKAFNLLPKDMIAVRISPDIRMAVVDAPSYLTKRDMPRTPPERLSHNCVNLRLPTYDSNLIREFEKNGKEFNVHVEGQLTLAPTTRS
ncbi:MAG TPA: hypothetical protein VM661_14880 [Candidatus Sulfotelmatobacter sp.]|jgi:hypothetical protein|nr:hypothetical protein [Candidatus Sulfotelmatobacter sp.]